jgi:8-oxo-dGTP pyrophosphatase MutT (NUDIX family)/phosphohistidine phosphatase SixA
VALGVAAQTDGVDALSRNDKDAAEPIRAAGGVLTRSGPHGVTVALVHRPRHDDWTLPKGKLHRGEHPVVAARREVWEETGVEAWVGVRLPSVSYQVPVGQGAQLRLADKVVDFWVMRSVSSNGFVPGAETDELAWLTLAQAQERASYERDVMVLGAFADLPPLRDPVLLVRHAQAGEQERWSGPDELRPLDKVGEARAVALTETLACFGPARLVSASPLRCRQTLAPLAASLGLGVEIDAAFNEDADTDRAADLVRDLSTGRGATVICSQGKMIPPLLATLAGGEPAAYATPKGGGWVLCLGPSGGVLLDPLP